MATKLTQIWRAAVVSLVGLLAFGVNAQKATSTAEFKNLAGPADEIQAMRLPAPESVGTRSRSAMFPIVGSGAQDFDIPVDSADNFKLVLLSPRAKELSLFASTSGEKFVDLRAAVPARGVTRVESTYGLDGNSYPAEVFTFEGLKPGTLRVRVELPTALASGERVGWLVASSDSPYRLYSYVDTLSTTVGREIGIVTSLFDVRGSDETGKPSDIPATLSDSRVEITAPDGRVSVFPMTGDLALRAAFRPRLAGRYTAQVIAAGTLPEGGAEFIRTSEISFEVAPAAVSIRPGVRAALTDDLRWRVSLPVDGLAAGRTAIVHGEVWARDNEGDEFPVAWIGGMTRAEVGKGRAVALPVSLDSRWLARADDAAVFWLRNIRVQDPETNVLLGEAPEVALRGVGPTALAKSFYGVENDEMRQGARPARIPSMEAVGGKLMLVHGYCSGDAWGPAAAAGQFSNYVKFLDLNQNRSHDQFARLIRDFGASRSSFGIVAHSQGGAASLHLYTYYWSGLDYATGTRLIQSVGTPYQGTALAGNLALLGQIFGAGCGSNYDLTYSGAASWLAGIPIWARAKVYYHTTAFTDVWYRYDYCNIATDPFLSDPDDGVVERAYAQLPGAFNLGHKTGWCHTSGMRDPAQTQDSSRNANMNANAAR